MSGNPEMCLCLLVWVSLPLFAHRQCWPSHDHFSHLGTDLLRQQRFITQASWKYRARCKSVSAMSQAWICWENWSFLRGSVGFDGSPAHLCSRHTAVHVFIGEVEKTPSWWVFSLDKTKYLIYLRSGAPLCRYFVLLKTEANTPC